MTQESMISETPPSGPEDRTDIGALFEFIRTLGQTIHSTGSGGIILAYLGQWKPLPWDMRDIKEPWRWTAYGICGNTGVPLATGYHVIRKMVDDEYLTIHPFTTMVRSQTPQRIYELTPLGRRWAEGLKALQRYVEGEDGA